MHLPYIITEECSGYSKGKSCIRESKTGERSGVKWCVVMDIAGSGVT